MQLAIPRYTQKGFPKYRYIPSVNPHPGIHPEGHSYQKPEEKIEYLPPENWARNEHYLYGIDLFNHGYWWEAHEAWEGIWLTTKKLDLYGQYLQALIQFSAGFLKLYSGTKAGFDKLFKEAQGRFQFCLRELGDRHRFMGLNLVEWQTRLETFANLVKDPKGEITDPLKFASFPAILLEDDPKLS